MNFLLIGGQPDTGKSETISRLFLFLSPLYPKITNVNPHRHSPLPPSTPLHDFSALLEGVDQNGKQIKILIHSATDDHPNIDMLRENIENHQPDIVITSIRDIGWERDLVIRIIDKNYHFEIPLARITRRHHHRGVSLSWYRASVDHLIHTIISSRPFNLI